MRCLGQVLPLDRLGDPGPGRRSWAGVLEYEDGDGEYGVPPPGYFIGSELIGLGPRLAADRGRPASTYVK